MFIHGKGAILRTTGRRIGNLGIRAKFPDLKTACIIALISCFLFLIIGCGEEGDKNLIEARAQIQSGKYKSPQELSQINASLKSALAKEADNSEILCPLRATEIINSGASPESQKKAIADILASVAKLESQIKKLEAVDKDLITDNEKNQLEKLQRKWYLTLEPTAILLTSDSQWIQNVRNEALNLLVESFKVINPHIHSRAVDLMVQFKDQSYDILVNALQNEDMMVRRQSLIALGKIGDERAIEPIAKLLDDEDAGVKFHVPISLNLIGGQNIIAPLHDALKNQMAQVRMISADFLGEMKDETSVPLLIDLLTDDIAYIRSSAANALTKIGSPAIPDLMQVIETQAENVTLLPSDFVGDKIADKYKKELTKRASIQSYVATILGDMKDMRAIPKLLQAMKHTATADATEEEKTNALTVRTSASTALGVIGAPAVEGLITIASNENETETARVNAISVLGIILDKRAVVPLIATLKDQNKAVRATSATTLGVIKDRRALVPLMDALQDSDVVARINAATALGLLADKTATQSLLAILNNKDEREKLRTAALDSLGLIKDTTSLEPILKILIDEYEKDGIRKSAATALRLMENAYPSEAVIALLKGELVYPIIMPEKGTVTKWLKEKGDDDFIRNVTPLVQIKTDKGSKEITSPDTGGLVEIYMANGTEAEAGAILGLISYRDRDIEQEERSSIRNMAASALGLVKGENAVPALMTAVNKDKNGAVRKNAASSLRELDKAQAIPALLKAMKGDDSGVVRSEAAYALGVSTLMSADSVPALINTLRKDKYESARIKAAWSLGELLDKRAVKPLIDVIVEGKDDAKEAPAVITEAITALDKLAGNAIDPAIAVLKDENIDEVPRSYAARILGLIESPNAVEPLMDALKYDSVVIRSESAKALGLINDRRATEALISVIKDSNEWITVRINAVSLLGNIKDERAVLPLIDELKSDVTAIRDNAVVALGNIKDKRAVPLLTEMLQNPKEDDAVRANAITSLAKIADSSASTAILGALKSDNETIRQNAVIATGDLPIMGAVDELLSIVRDLNELVALRASAAEALGKLNDRRAIPVLVDRIGDPGETDTLWIQAAASAGKLKAQTIPALVEQKAKDVLEPVVVRNAALMAMSGTGNNQDFAVILEMLDNATLEIRYGSALALGNTGRRDAVEPLITKLQNDVEEAVRNHSAKALSQMADPGSEQALIKSFNEDAASVKNEAAIGLGNINKQAGISVLISVVQDNTKANDHRWNSAIALGDANASQAVTALQTALNDNNGTIHFESAEALRKITGQTHGYER